MNNGVMTNGSVTKGQEALAIRPWGFLGQVGISEEMTMISSIGNSFTAAYGSLDKQIKSSVDKLDSFSNDVKEYRKNVMARAKEAMPKTVMAGPFGALSAGLFAVS